MSLPCSDPRVADHRKNTALGITFRVPVCACGSDMADHEEGINMPDAVPFKKCAYCDAQPGGDRPCCEYCRRDPHAHCPSWPNCTRAGYRCGNVGNVPSEGVKWT